MKKYTLASAITVALLATGCDKASDKAAPGAAAPAVVAVGEVVATVNGKPISKAAFEILSDEVNERRGENKVPEDKIIEELIKRELLSQEIGASGALKDPKFAAKIENAQRMMMSQAAAEQFIETVQVTDEDLKKEYDDRVGPMKTAEYKAKHILVETEAAAKDIIAKLAKGEKFDALAKKFSKDPGSKDKGGDLGWFSPQQMVAPFSEAVIAMKNGEITQTPVQSQFGWHVIQREESREQAPPPFDAVKDQLKNMVQTKKLQEHITELQTKAKVENKLPAKPAEAAKPAAPAPAGAKPAAPAPAPDPAPAPAAKPAAPAPAPAAPQCSQSSRLEKAGLTAAFSFQRMWHSNPACGGIGGVCVILSAPFWPTRYEAT
jgi:peptidyl-prolyl cis-trans isomerase C